jgi:alpha-D-ribose 1-methylphosphonate 5-triphosphate synthase subunit PhnG
MMPVQDSVEQSPFYLGEVLITEATVEIEGTIGYGFTLEVNLERALCFAIIDAALRHDLPEAREIQGLLARQTEIIKNKRLQEKRLIAATRVNFTTLEG